VEQQPRVSNYEAQTSRTSRGNRKPFNTVVVLEFVGIVEANGYAHSDCSDYIWLIFYSLGMLKHDSDIVMSCYHEVLDLTSRENM
jgi:hypothetical protein